MRIYTKVWLYLTGFLRRIR